MNMRRTTTYRRRFLLPIHLLVLIMVTIQSFGPTGIQSTPGDSPRVPIGCANRE